MAQQPGDRLASRLVGLNIQNTGDENIGEIYDIILTDAGAVKAYIVSVGGFLGMGPRYALHSDHCSRCTAAGEMKLQ
jgi:hypothetical protein